MNVGVTGHQNLIDESTIKWIKFEISNEIQKRNISTGFTSLAIGADQLFAQVVIDNKIPVIAIIPSKYYEQTFKNEKEKTEYNHFLNKVSKKIVLDYERPSEEAFYQAGKQIVYYADLLFAIWNGKPSKGLGGTADIVIYANSLKKEIIHLNPETKIKKYINYG